ncbi:MAG: hypothetical protein HY762_00960 [Planctomycetes bacterium]|nr:hypothetical protein [Planctomycetota bacterium]
MDKLMSRIGWAIILTVVLPLGYGGLCDKGDSNSSSGAFLSEIGTVRFIDIEGGFYGINGDTGQNYDPINLGTECKIQI